MSRTRQPRPASMRYSRIFSRLGSAGTSLRFCTAIRPLPALSWCSPCAAGESKRLAPQRSSPANKWPSDRSLWFAGPEGWPLLRAYVGAVQPEDGRLLAGQVVALPLPSRLEAEYGRRQLPGRQLPLGRSQINLRGGFCGFRGFSTLKKKCVVGFSIGFGFFRGVRNRKNRRNRIPGLEACHLPLCNAAVTYSCEPQAADHPVGQCPAPPAKPPSIGPARVSLRSGYLRSGSFSAVSRTSPTVTLRSRNALCHAERRAVACSRSGSSSRTRCRVAQGSDIPTQTRGARIVADHSSNPPHGVSLWSGLPATT